MLVLDRVLSVSLFQACSFQKSQEGKLELYNIQIGEPFELKFRCGWRHRLVGVWWLWAWFRKRPQSAEKEDVKNCFSNQSETTLERAVFCVCKPWHAPCGGEVTTKCLAYLYGTYVGHIRQGERIRESKEMIDESLEKAPFYLQVVPIGWRLRLCWKVESSANLYVARSPNDRKSRWPHKKHMWEKDRKGQLKRIVLKSKGINRRSKSVCFNVGTLPNCIRQHRAFT